MSKNFASLHTHTSYSQLDGASKVDEFIARVKALGMTSAGISDHGNLSGIIDFYKECKKQDVHPVLGQEFYFSEDRTLKESVQQEDANGVIDGSDKRYYHLSIYAEDNDGYQNLLKLSSDAFANGLYYKPRSDYAMLERHSKGLIVGSGCLGGPVLQPLLYGDYDGALRTAQRLQDCVGKDNFFIELMNHGLPEQHRTNPQLVDIAKRIGARVYATQDTHYTHQEDAAAHEILLCQPPGTMVEVVIGTNQKGLPRGSEWKYVRKQVPIESIEEGDRVTSWAYTPSRSKIRVGGSLVTKVGSRYYDGDLIEVETATGQKSSYTEDHICVARIGHHLDAGNHIVYMQRRGGMFRIGKTQYMKPVNKLRPNAAVLGILTRAKEQNADAAWILSVHETDHEAREAEAFTSWLYNIPTWSFTGVRKRGHEPRTPFYESLWDRVGDLTERAIICLEAHGKSILYPFWDQQADPLNQIRPLWIRAMNLESGMTMCVPEYLEDGKTSTSIDSGAWRAVKVTRRPYQGTVYSMDVEGDHTYLADGLVTHNCCQTGAKLSEKHFHFHNDEYYLKSPDQMYDLFSDLPEACDNTLLIAERCNVKIDFDSLHLPKFQVPWGFATDIDYLIHLTRKGIEKYYPDASDEIYERAAYELGVFESMGVASYMLILWDLLKFARNEGIFTPPGRGSAAGSLVSYVLGVTKVDPIKYGLIFERFLNPSRIALPDADLDIEQRYREKMINYTIQKYGSENVAQIITFGKIKARTAVKDTARVLGYPPTVGNKISSLMPPVTSGVDIPLKNCFEFSEKYENGYKAAQGLREEYARDPDVKKIIDSALGIEGLIKSSGIHAAGVVIGDRPLDELVPTWVNSDGVRATQWDKKVVEDLGLVKMDYLGLKNLDILSDTEKLIGNGFKIDKLPMDDPATFAMLKTGETVGCFQIESSGMQSLLKRLRPDSIEDISAVLALFRPGPMAQNWHNMYADRKNGREAATPFHPDAAEILRETYGLMIYQEEIMEVARAFAGYSLTEADNLRKIIGKKLPDEMKAEAGKFISGCMSMGHTEEFGRELFDTIDGFSLYGFNKAHSVAYAFITYWTAYLKTHYPREYMAVLCSYVMDELSDTAKYLGEARRMGLKVYPPDVNSSMLQYTVEDDGIRIGLGTLKNMGSGSALELIKVREEKPFESLYDLALRVNPKAPAFKSLAFSGALDQWGTRQGISSVVGEILAASRKDAKKQDQMSMFASDEVIDFKIPTTEFAWHELLAKEKEVLGIYASGHPLSEYEEHVTGQTISDAVEAGDKAVIKTLAIVDNIEVKYTRTQKTMANATVEDQTGAIDIVIFPKTYEDYGMFLQPGAVVRIGLRKGWDDFRDQPNYILTFAEPVESKLSKPSELGIFRVFVPKGFHSKPQWMSRLKGTLLQNSGSVPIEVYVSRSTKIKLDNQYLVNGSTKLKDELKALFVQFRGGE